MHPSSRQRRSRLRLWARTASSAAHRLNAILSRSAFPTASIFACTWQAATGLFIGKPVLGRVSKRITLQVSDRVESPDGKLAGIIVFSISPEFLDHTASTRAPGQKRLHDPGRHGWRDPCLLCPLSEVGRRIHRHLDVRLPRVDRLRLRLSGAYMGPKCPLNAKARLRKLAQGGGLPSDRHCGLGRSGGLRGRKQERGFAGRHYGRRRLALTLTITLILYREIGLRVQREFALVDESRKVMRANENLQERHQLLLKTSAELTAERARLQRLNRELARAKEQAVNANQRRRRCS